MQLPYAEELNTGYLARLFDNTSECYKLFWFKAIVTAVGDGKLTLTYEDLIDKMIADAWYIVMISCFRNVKQILERENELSLVK